MYKSKAHFISIVVPVFKKERIIVKHVKGLYRVLNKLRYRSEIITVIDGRIDRSEERLRKSAIPTVRVIAYKKNQGKAYAIRHGMYRARGDYVMFIDAGREIDVSGISMLLEHMEWYKADIIVGSKRHPASLIIYSWQRKLLSLGYYWFVRIFFGLNIRDTQAGIKIFRKAVLKKILPRLVEKKFAGDLEILVAAQANGYKRIYEAPIKLDYRLGDITNAATMLSIYHIFTDTLAIWYRNFILKHYRA